LIIEGCRADPVMPDLSDDEIRPGSRPSAGVPWALLASWMVIGGSAAVRADASGAR